MNTLAIKELAEFADQIIPLMLFGNFLSVLLALMVFQWVIQPLVNWFKS